MVIAAEAYRELSPELKAQAFDVLKAHPDFQKWTNAYHLNSNFDLPSLRVYAEFNLARRD